MKMGAPTDCGRRLIPQILDSLAVAEPDRIIYSIAQFTNDVPTFRQISARNFQKAVDKTAWWLREQLGQHARIRTVGYIGPHDIRHILLTYASVKAGCTALFLSPKNSVEGALAVLNAAECSIWVKPREQPCLPLVEDFLQRRSMRVLELPKIDELLNADFVEPFPYTKSFDEATREPFCLLHTSGSTGLPKPISWSHGLIGTMEAVRLLPPSDGDDGLVPWTSQWNEGDRIYSSFPMSHGAGIIMNIILPSLFGLHCILGPADVLPNMNLVESLADHANINIWSMVPSLVDELGETPDVLAKFKSAKFICASGGPVSPISAGKVNDVVRVLNLTGTTEGLFIGNLVVEREDWLWFAFHPYSGFEFKEVEPGVFEHWIHRNEHWSSFQGIFHTFPNETSINIKDLYVKHPTKPNLWAFKGRSDDIVVLSNGYKISPLDTEALITTHPAIEGCLLVGTGKAQAGLLIELKDPASKTDELFESIWLMIERANKLSLHKNQLHRDYVAFVEPGKAFVRTDKGTVKRRATLALFADYIEQFYSSRDEDPDTVIIDTTSTESIADSIRSILGSMLPALRRASPDTDLFSLGLDSLLVFRVVKNIRAAMGVHDHLAPRHLYAYPTINKFSSFLARLVTEARASSSSNQDAPVDDALARMKRMVEEHKARLSFRTNPLDHVNPNFYLGLEFYFALRKDVGFEETFTYLQKGLRRTMQLIPALDGKIILDSEHEIGYKKGDLRVSFSPVRATASLDNSSIPPRQLRYKDLSQTLPSFEKLQADGFVPVNGRDELVLRGNPFPSFPADVLIAQANFVEGGCILALNIHHACVDGVGAIIALKVWAESCRYIQGDVSATCSWLDPENFNHSLPGILHELEGHARPAHEVDPGVWAYLPFVPPEQQLPNGTSQTEHTHALKEGALPPPPKFPAKHDWPPLPGKPLTTSMFLIPPGNVEKLKQDVIADPATKGVITNISDILQAFIWRTAIKARYRVATELRGETFGPDELSILELPFDGRPYFSSLLPSSYMGSMLLTNRPNMPVTTLCSPTTSIGQVALAIREATARITPSLVHDAYTLLESMPDYTKFTSASQGLSGMHAMISNTILFQTSEISFGDGFFADGGSPHAMRPQMDRCHQYFRFLVIFPMRRDGGVELVLGTYPEELEMLRRDEELGRYARLVESS